MKSINSTEMLSMLETEVLKGSLFELDSTTYFTNQSTNNNQTLKNSESFSTIRYTQNDISIIEERFQSLEQDYEKLMQQTKRKRQVFLKQRSQLQKHIINHQKGRKQIERLRSLICLAKKNQVISKQVESQQTEKHTIPIRYRNSASTPKNRNVLQLNKTTDQQTGFFVLKDTNYGIRRVSRRQQSELQLPRYRLVPPVCLN